MVVRWESHCFGFSVVSNLTREERYKTAEEYTRYMREESWQFGHCQDDLLLVVVKNDKMVRES
jgi:uncharacterized membrane protein YgcG